VTNGRARHRWDRLVALHLITLAFIESCGYKWHHRDVRQRVGLATSMLLYPEMLEHEFDIWLPRLGLAKEKEMRRVRKALRTACQASEASDASAPAARAARVHAAIAHNKDSRGLVHELPPLKSPPDPAAPATHAALDQNSNDEPNAEPRMTDAHV
jgi:hypothetical protein